VLVALSQPSKSISEPLHVCIAAVLRHKRTLCKHSLHVLRFNCSVSIPLCLSNECAVRPCSTFSHTHSDSEQLLFGKAPPSTLVQVIQCLTELGLSFTKARVTSDGGWFVDGASFLGPSQDRADKSATAGERADSYRFVRPIHCIEPSFCFQRGSSANGPSVLRRIAWLGSQFTAIRVETPLGMQNSTFMIATGLSRIQRSSLQWKRS
jgi:hypothetical protein